MFLFSKKALGALWGKQVYHYLDGKADQVLYTPSINLFGKPNAVIKKNGAFIQIEVKKTVNVSRPYKNHIAQLMAYCLLVEEYYGKMPPYGIIKYEDQEFKIEYGKPQPEGIRQSAKKMLENEQSGRKFYCHHPKHNINNPNSQQ